MTATMERDHVADDVLVASAAGGSKDAFAVLYERHHAAALRLARRLTRCAADADDVVAETFAGVWRALGNGHGPRDSFRTYLLTSVRRNCGRQASGARRTTPSDSVEEVGAPAEAPDVDGLPDRDVLDAAFRSLPPRWQAVLWQSEVEELSPAAVASKLGIGRRAAIALAHRARRGLGQAYLHAFAAQHARVPCADVAPLIVESVVGHLHGSRRERVDDHVLCCAACAELQGDLRGLQRGLRSLAGPAAVVPAALGLGRGAIASVVSKLTMPELWVALTFTAAAGVAMPGETWAQPARVVAPPISPSGSGVVATDDALAVSLAALPSVPDDVAAHDAAAPTPQAPTVSLAPFADMSGVIVLPDLSVAAVPIAQVVSPLDNGAPALDSPPVVDIDPRDADVGADVTVPVGATSGVGASAYIGLTDTSVQTHASIPNLVDARASAHVTLPIDSAAAPSANAQVSVGVAGLGDLADVSADVRAPGVVDAVTAPLTNLLGAVAPAIGLATN